MDSRTAFEIGVEGYVFLYPVVLMEITRQQMTNVEHAGYIGSSQLAVLNSVGDVKVTGVVQSGGDVRVKEMFDRCPVGIHHGIKVPVKRFDPSFFGHTVKRTVAESAATASCHMIQT